MSVLFKMTRIFFIAVILLLNKSYAQNITTSLSLIKGESFEQVASKVSYVDGFDVDGNTYVVFADGRNETEHYLAQINSSMKQTNYKKIDLEALGKKVIFEHIQLFDNNLYLFSSIIDYKMKTKILSVQTIDKKTLVPNNDIIKIEDFDISKCIAYVTPINKNMYFKASKDKSKLALCFMMPTNEKISIVVLDNKTKVLWKRTVILKSKNDVNYNMEFDVNNAGDVCYKLRSKDPNRILNSGQKAVYYVLGCFNNGTIEKEFPLDIKEKAIKELSLSISDSSIICAGYVCKLDPGNAFGSNKMWGSCFFKIDIRSKKIAMAKYADFDRELFNTSNTDEAIATIDNKIEEDKNFLYLDYVTTDILLADNGTVFLLGEYLKQTENSSMFGNILVISFSNDGDIYWSKQIYKVQYDLNPMDYFSSFSSVAINDNLYLIFNDYVSNLNIKRGELPEIYKASKPSVLAMVKIDVKGNATKETIINYDMNDFYMLPFNSQLVGGTELILIGNSKSKCQLFKAIFKK